MVISGRQLAMARPRPRLIITQILAWADGHFDRTGDWPTAHSGPVVGGKGETWLGIHSALYSGCRGFPGGSSLAKVFATHRAVRKGTLKRRFTIKQILAWADAHHQRTGNWPLKTTGFVHGAPDEKWFMIDGALRRGMRGLRGGSSLSRLLAEHRNARGGSLKRRLTIERILAWGDAHHKRTGEWPHKESGRIVGARAETWSGVNAALSLGLRGLPGDSTLSKLLVTRRGALIRGYKKPLSTKHILTWAKAHHKRTGNWPKAASGAIHGVRGETWSAVDNALTNGTRGIRERTTLAALLFAHCGVLSQPFQQQLTKKKIRAWAATYKKRSGEWPISSSGAVKGVPGENWRKIDNALRLGLRGLPGGSSLSQLLSGARPATAVKVVRRSKGATSIAELLRRYRGK